jgi:hypothetical protein
VGQSASASEFFGSNLPDPKKFHKSDDINMNRLPGARSSNNNGKRARTGAIRIMQIIWTPGLV